MVKDSLRHLSSACVWDNMSKENYQVLGLVFHGILSSYQRAIRDTLGNSDAAILHLVDYLCENMPLRDVDVSKLGFEELISVLAGQVEKMKLGKVVLEKLDHDSYLFRYEQCVWAELCHQGVKRYDVPCPWALIALALFQASTGHKVFIADSEYLPDGTVTKIRPVSDISRQIYELKE